MPRDQKVGLALGVLLVGAVAALFFRNEPPARSGAPQLRNAAALDAEIAEKDSSPYLPDASGSGKVTRTAAKPVSDGPTLLAPETDSAAPGGARLEFSDEDPFAGSAPSTTPAGPAPEPIQLEFAPLGGAPGKPAPRTPGDAHMKTHVVQKGESLSTIAGKYLGSQGRFHEIFEANRDQLKDANDLRVGMKLVIPDGSTRSEPKSAAGVPTPDRSSAAEVLPQPARPATPDKAAPSAEERKKFVPYRRSPLNRSTSMVEPIDGMEPAGRRLTQLPPADGDLVIPR